MFEQMEEEIDAVTITIPDHMHAPVALRAVEAKKHVYCQKPLTHNIGEAGDLTLAARQAGIVSPMGIQTYATIGYRSAIEMIQRGGIGRIKEVGIYG